MAQREGSSIERLIESLSREEPPFSSLGVPVLADTEATRAIVEYGQAALVPLQQALSSADPKIAMYAAYTLGLRGDRSSLPALRRALERQGAEEEPIEFAVRSALARAIEAIEAGN